MNFSLFLSTLSPISRFDRRLLSLLYDNVSSKLHFAGQMDRLWTKLPFGYLAEDLMSNPAFNTEFLKTILFVRRSSP